MIENRDRLLGNMFVRSRPNEISYAKWKVLSELYDHPSDIDLFTAGLAENEHYNGGTVT